MTPSQSAPDLNRSVTDLVGRFNTLAVKDVDEEKTARQLKRLEAALRRAEIAREEAETEAKHLRHELKDIKEVGEEWVEEKKALKGRCEEFEVCCSCQYYQSLLSELTTEYRKSTKRPRCISAHKEANTTKSPARHKRSFLNAKSNTGVIALPSRRNSSGSAS